MPSKARIKVTKVRTTKTVKVAKNRNKSGGNPHKCPTCGKFMGHCTLHLHYLLLYSNQHLLFLVLS